MFDEITVMLILHHKKYKNNVKGMTQYQSLYQCYSTIQEISACTHKFKWLLFTVRTVLNTGLKDYQGKFLILIKIF